MLCSMVGTGSFLSLDFPPLEGTREVGAATEGTMHKFVAEKASSKRE